MDPKETGNKDRVEYGISFAIRTDRPQLVQDIQSLCDADADAGHKTYVRAINVRRSFKAKKTVKA